MIGKTTSTVMAGVALALAVLLLPAVSARAGCGCDHPPPDWAMVMPPFGSPGALIRIFPNGGEFLAGHIYKIDFGGAAVVNTVATSSDYLEVVAPKKLAEKLGPMKLHVQGEDYDHEYGEEFFTALPPALVVPPGSGKYLNAEYETAIAADGSVLIPVDVGAVLDPTQFAMAFEELALAFDADDIVIYNADGVDLTLFTLEVDDPTQREWGEYYGLEVEQDAGLYGVPYEAEAVKPFDYRDVSSILTYWRHEFHTYADAHAWGGSHELGKDGRHPDGTLHVDHDQLVFAISGLERDENVPWNLAKAESLDPGSRKVNLIWVSLVSPEPVSEWSMALMAELDLGIEVKVLPLAEEED